MAPLRALLCAALALALACGEVGEQPTSGDCLKIREQICAEAKNQGVGPNPCSDGGAFFAEACDKLREKCGGTIPQPTCP